MDELEKDAAYAAIGSVGCTSFIDEQAGCAMGEQNCLCIKMIEAFALRARASKGE